VFSPRNFPAMSSPSRNFATIPAQTYATISVVSKYVTNGCKTYLNLGKPFVSRHILHQHNTLAPSLYQCVETRSIEVFCLLSQPLPHLRFNLFVISETFVTQLWTALRDKHFPP
jgi:hypothetical protein